MGNNYLSNMDIEDYENVLIKDSEARDMIGKIENLKTKDKSSTVAAINEIYDATLYQNVKYYGAVGDGVTDDTVAFQTAIDNMPVHGTLLIPIGTYLISATLNINKPMRLLGEYSGWDVEEATQNITNTKFKESLLKFTNINTAISVTILGFTMEHVSILKTIGGNGVTIDISSGEVTTFDRFITIFNCTIASLGISASTAGLIITMCGLTLIERVHVYGFDVGFFVNGNINTSMTLISCWAQNYTGTGYNINNLAYSSLINCAADTLTATANGYVMTSCFGVDLINCGAESNETGVYFDNCEQCGLSGEVVSYGSAQNGVCLRYSGHIAIRDFKIIKSNVPNDYYPLRISTAGIRVILENTNIDKIYNVEEEYICTTGGFFESNVEMGTFTAK